MSSNENDIKKGGISVDTQHIFPIIKKWLYSEKDIFLREIVSNASDAITKLRRLSSLGVRDDAGESYKISVTLDKEAGTLSVSDNGIGMTAQELERYICSIALSGAVEFIQKYEKESGEGGSKNGIIGHFGLGFYSAFMVSNRVEVITRSYTDAPAMHWECLENGEYEMSPCEKEGHGTDVIMHIGESESEFLESSKIRAILEKYCSFMPVEIYFESIGEKDAADGGELINDTLPLWQRPAAELSEEDYKSFYAKVFNDFRDPLFHIHINADYPLNFKGILYFPQIANEYETIEGQVKLYYNQVYVADNIKEVIPEYLLMLKGVLDCPELPLNVSRSYLQTNTYVAKLSAHIVKKVGDKLLSLCNNSREEYARIWKDIAPFIEYACIKDKKFYDKTKNALLLTLTDGSCMTYEEYLNAAKEKHEGKIYYCTDRSLQAQYVSLFESAGISVALMERPIDVQFATIAEQYMEGVKFLRVDAGIDDMLKEGESAAESEALRTLFAPIVGEKVKVEFSALKDRDVPAVLNIAEETRRMDEFMRMYGLDTSAHTPESTLILNTASPLIQKLESLASDSPDKASEMASFMYKLSMLSQKKLSAEEMQDLLKAGFDLMLML